MMDYEDLTRRNVIYMYRREFRAAAKGNKDPIMGLTGSRRRSFRSLGLCEKICNLTPLCLDLLNEELKNE